MPDISIQLIIGVIVVLMGLRDAFVAKKKKAEAERARIERARTAPAAEPAIETGRPQRSAWEEFGMDEEEEEADEEATVFEPVSRPEAPPSRPVKIEAPPRPLPVEAPPRPVRVEAPRPVVIAPPRTPTPFQFPAPFGGTVPSPAPRPEPAMYMTPLSPTQRRDLSAGRPRRGIALDSRSARQAVVYMAVFGTPRGLDENW
jgi:hypothetical protein